MLSRKGWFVLILAVGLFCGITWAEGFTKADVLDLVDDAVQLLESDGEKALKVIGQKKGPFDQGALYVFVYDESVVMAAHPVKPYLVGKSYKGKPDVKGKNFRDEIVLKALSGSGWTDYFYQKPGDKGLFKKKVFSRLAVADGKKYIVCAGMDSK